MKTNHQKPGQVNYKQLSILSVVLILLCSCGSIYYAPNQPNMPMIKEKGQSQITAALGAGEYSSTIDLGVTHSITNHAGLTANFASYELDGNVMNTIDVGAGYFLPLSDKAGFEVYPSVGYGKLNVVDDWGEEYIWDSKLFRASVTPDVFYESEHFGAAFGLRLIYFKYTSPEISYFGISQSHVMLEPTVCITAGWNHFKFKLQGTYSNKINKGYLDYDNTMLSFGFNVKLGNKKVDNGNVKKSAW